jgi:3-oxoacyl-[acyl-carrier protein] reductase
MTEPLQAAIVTGGSRGIGAAVCRRLARDGFGVVVNYAGSKDDAEAVVAEIAAAGGRARAVQGDERPGGSRRPVRCSRGGFRRRRRARQ